MRQDFIELKLIKTFPGFGQKLSLLPVTIKKEKVTAWVKGTCNEIAYTQVHIEGERDAFLINETYENFSLLMGTT